MRAERNWVNPVVARRGYRPVVSDDYSATKTARHREHHGVDVMFRRKNMSDQLAYLPGTPNGSPGYFMPDGTLAIAAADGTLWSSRVSPGGISIVIDHGKPWATYYQHLSLALVPMGISGGKGGIRISRGQPIGIIGGSPLEGDHLKHLHFEMWKGGGAEASVDPQLQGFDVWPILEGAAVRGTVIPSPGQGLAVVALIGGLALASAVIYKVAEGSQR